MVNQPLGPAIDLGAKNIFVFIPSPVGFEMTGDLVDIALSTISTWMASSLVSQFETIAKQNEIFMLKEKRRPIRLCVVRPSFALPAGLLDFGSRVEELIGLGEEACEQRLRRFDPDNHLTWDPYATTAS